MSVLLVDDALGFRYPARAAAGLVTLRRRLEEVFGRVIENPSAGLNELPPAEADAVDTRVPLLRSSYREMNDDSRGVA